MKDFDRKILNRKKELKIAAKKRLTMFGRWLRVACGESLFDPKRACQHQSNTPSPPESAGGLNRQSRNHRPPIHLEGLVRMSWVGQVNS